MFTIRRADISDLEQVVALRLDFLREFQQDKHVGPELVEATREYLLDKFPKGEFLVWLAEEDGRIVGTSGLILYHKPPVFGNLHVLQPYILNMYTIPECRGRGVATVLIQHIIAYVKTIPANRITLHASEMGRPVYEKLGFVATGTEMKLAL